MKTKPVIIKPPVHVGHDYPSALSSDEYGDKTINPIYSLFGQLYKAALMMETGRERQGIVEMIRVNGDTLSSHGVLRLGDGYSGNRSSVPERKHEWREVRLKNETNRVVSRYCCGERSGEDVRADRQSPPARENGERTIRKVYRMRIPAFPGNDENNRLFTNTRLKDSLVRLFFNIISPLLNRRNFMG
jgi:hypothetical protein